MGVHNLWKLLSASGRSIQLSQLQGSIVAIDVSIWMIRIIHGMARAGVQNFSRGHLIGILKRLMYLLEQGIKPVFVFDGPAPPLKRKTRNKYQSNLQKVAERYIVKLMEQGVDVLTENSDQLQEENTLQELIQNIEKEIEDFEVNDPVEPEFVEIEQQQKNHILSAKYRYFSENYSDAALISQDEFDNLNLSEKQCLIEDLEEELFNVQTNICSNGKYSMHKLSKQMLHHYMRKAQLKEDIKKIRIEAQKQIEQKKIQKILENVSDEHSKLLQEYLLNTEDIEIKLGQLGVTNIYVQLKDPQARKILIEKIYNFKKGQKQRRLKDWQLENEHMKHIRETIKRRYIQKQRDEEYENYIPQDNLIETENKQDFENLQDQYDCLDRYEIGKNLLSKLVNEDEEDYQQQIFIPQQQDQLLIEQQKDQISYSNQDESVYEQISVQTISEDEDKEQIEISNDNLESHQFIANEQSLEQKNFITISDEQQLISSTLAEISYSKQQVFEPQPLIQGSISNQDSNQKQLLEPPTLLKQKEIKQNFPQQEIEEQEIDQVLSIIENQDENITTDEMLNEILKFTNLNSLDFGSLQTKFDEVKYLLEIFGIPWVDAPAESEAQCSFLQIENLVDFVITDDSDAFLFGATRVIKGLFEQRQSLEYYDTQLLFEELGLNREKLIYLALFLGSDYTEGIKGVGIVNAMEIVEAFDTVEGLMRFSEWAQKADILIQNVQEHYVNIPEKERLYKEHHKNFKKYWELPSNFPSLEVIQAYIDPLVDKSKERFSWGKPAVEKIKQFCLDILKWDEVKVTQNIIEPLQRFLKQNYQQNRITDYFRPQMQQKIAMITSRRIKDAVGNLIQPDQSRQQVQSLSTRKMMKQIMLEYESKKKQNKKKIQNPKDLGDLQDYKFKKKIKKQI